MSGTIFYQWAQSYASPTTPISPYDCQGEYDNVIGLRTRSMDAELAFLYQSALKYDLI
ncbi:hypothetical protein [uncultured Shewanella sp.]|uniref:hypothetical protein n=1 Tax=uncultured Shewanella sp. TaxID=173975 RepID=UPI002620DB9B|nr:hypothetical protein [uncultured Shewanella sp.]